MTLYGIALYLHILAAVGIVGGSCAGHYIHVRMHRAQSLDALREWLSAERTISKLMPIFALTLLVCGAYMTFAVWGWSQPWIIVSLALLVSISLASPLLLAPSLKKVGAAVARGESLSAIVLLLNDPVANYASGVFTAEALAIVLLMATKTTLPLTLGIVVVAAIIGAILGRPKAIATSAHATSVTSSAGAGRIR